MTTAYTQTNRPTYFVDGSRLPTFFTDGSRLATVFVPEPERDVARPADEGQRESK